MDVRLGDLVELCELRNADLQFDVDDVRGISTQKEFIATKANLDGVGLGSYKLVKPEHFAYVADTSRRGDKISLAFNASDDTYLVSSISTVFKVKSEKLDSRFLYIFFNRPEFDRYARYHSWGSAREAFSWEDMCNIRLNLPSIGIQRKYVAVYQSLLANLHAYERGLDDLKRVCDGYIEHLRQSVPLVRIGGYLKQEMTNNKNGQYGIDDVKGISIQKKFIETKANMENVSLKPYLQVKPRHFAYVTVTSRNGEKITIAHNSSPDTYLVSSSYEVFSVKDETQLLPEYLALFFQRAEFDRYARYHSWGSAREVFAWADLCDVKIPLCPNCPCNKPLPIFTKCGLPAAKSPNASNSKSTKSAPCWCVVRRQRPSEKW